MSREVEFTVATSKSSDYKWGLWVTQVARQSGREVAVTV